ncbi:MAG: S9 family peptidase [Candidatus Marinimicrobia bacterium]|nr:S9 family peptidase [Candidatus Neomarinimicrobiota bacterium]
MAPEKIKYPITPKEVIADQYFDTTIVDPYRWLEDDYSKQTKFWVDKQNAFTDRYLRKIPFRNKIEKKLKEIWDHPSTSVPFKKGEHYYYYYNSGMQNQSVLYVKDSINGEGEILIDPNEFSHDGSIALRGVYFSNDNNYMGYSISKSGSDWLEFFILDLKTKKLLNDHLKWIKFSGMSWYGNGFYYTKYPKPDNKQEYSGTNENSKVFYHHLGTPQSADEIIYYDPNQPKVSPWISVSEDERYLFLYKSKGTYGNTISYRDTWNNATGWIKLVDDYKSEISIIDVANGYFIAQTDRNAPFKKIIKINPDNPNENLWKQLITGNKNEVLYNCNLVGGKLLAHFTKDIISLWKAYDLDGNYLYTVDLPGKGIVNGFNGKKNDFITWYSFNNSVNPSTIYQYDISNNNSSVYKLSETSFNSQNYIMRQEFYISKDGTMVPIFLAHRKGLNMDMERPTLLYGYGGFNISIKPYFNKSNVILLESGGVYAIANIRGGSEYGEEWHKDGMLLNKQNVFDDFIYAAKYLFKEGITSPDYLAIKGGSNGGLLIGAVLNQRPDIFRVAFPEVGVMDMLRYEKFTIGHAWAVEYGTIANKIHFDNIIKYSPLHNIQNDYAYPSVMIYTADHDDRVVPAHSFKYAATLQNNQEGISPILIRIGKSAGHGAGKPTKKVIKEITDKWAFMFYEMGIDY